MVAYIMCLGSTGFVSCDADRPPAGTERGACDGNGTCNAGLVCASQRCVAQVHGPGQVSLVRGQEALRSSSVEAALQLRKIGLHQKRIFSETGSFVVGSVEPTPLLPCCRGPSQHCLSEPGDWVRQPVWQAVDFQVDEPSLFQYSLHSAPRSFTARAVGDLDCDGVPVVFELVGSVVDGEVILKLVEPPAGSL